MKKIILGSIILFSFFMMLPIVEAKQKPAVYMFTKKGCPACTSAHEYFENLYKENQDLFDLYIIEVFAGDWSVTDKALQDLVEEVYDVFNSPDGKPDVNIDSNGDGKADTYIIEFDKKMKINIDTDKDGKADVNIDSDKNKIADLNIDVDGDGKADVNIDSDKDGKADTNTVNADVNGDGKADLNIDTNNDGYPDINIDTGYNGIATPTIVIGDYMTVGLPYDTDIVYDEIVKLSKSETEINVVKDMAKELNVDLSKYLVSFETNKTDILIIAGIFVVLIAGFAGLVYVSKK